MNKATVALIMIVAVLAAAHRTYAEPTTTTANYVSLVRILAGKDLRYFGHKVAVSGYLAASGRLYLSKNYARVDDISSSITVLLPKEGTYPKECSDRFVTVKGVLSKDSAGEPYISKPAEIIVPIQFAPLPCWPINKRIKGTFGE